MTPWCGGRRHFHPDEWGMGADDGYALPGSYNAVFAYDASLNGKRFLKVQPPESGQAFTQISVVTNWFEELKQRGPAH